MKFKLSLLRVAILSAVSPLLFSFVQAANDSPWLEIDGHAIHPTQIVAKYKQPFVNLSEISEEQSALLSKIGMRVQHQFVSQPGLVILDSDINPFQPKSGYQGKDLPKTDRLSEQLKALIDSEQFQYVEYNYINQISAEPTDPSYADGTMWGHLNVGQEGGVEGADAKIVPAWQYSTGGDDVIVAVIDTGVRYTHEDLASQMWQNQLESAGQPGIDDDGNGVIDDIFGYNAVYDTGDPLDVDDHGTACAGVIGAAANEVGIVGVAQNVKIMAVKGLTAFGGTTSDLIACIDYSVDMGAHIINASWGGAPFSQAMYDSIAHAQNEGVLFVAAAGNDSMNTDIFPHFPSNYELENVISVGAMDRFDRMADFSNYGSLTVDLMAPGVEIYTTGSGDAADMAVGSTASDPDTDYDYMDGTSFAAPYVAGVAALIKGLFPNSEALEIRERILNSVEQSDAYISKAVTNGRLNAEAALDVDPDGVLELKVSPANRSVLLRGTAQDLTVRVTDLIPVTDATVTAVLSFDGTTVEFLNDGSAPDTVAADALYTATVELPNALDSVELSITASAPGKETINTTVTYNLVDPPSNDNFGKSTKVAPGGASFVTNTNFATMEENEPSHGGYSKADHSVWYSWSPEADSQVLIDTAGSSFNTVISLYQGNELEDLILLNSSDVSQGKKDGYLKTDVFRGESYRICISSKKEGQGGSLRLRIQPGGTPDVSLPVVHISRPLNGLITKVRKLDVSGFSYDPQPNASAVQDVVMRVNGEIAGGSAIGTDNWQTTAYLRPGNNSVEVQAVDFAGNRSIVDKITVSYIDPEPANDHIYNAQVLDNSENSVEGNNSDATKQFGEPFHAGNRGGGSLWYRYDAEQSGVLRVTTRSATFDTLLAVYSTSVIDELDEALITSNDDQSVGTSSSRLTFGVQEGKSYWIAVDGFSNERGTFILPYAFSPSNLFSVTLSSEGSGTVSGNSGMIEEGQEISVLATPDFGYEFIAWSGSYDSSENPITFNVNSTVELIAVFKRKTVSEDFEDDSQRLQLVHGSAPWFITDETSMTGESSLRSAVIGNSESTSFKLTTILSDGRGKFDVKVSSEEGWDTLTFLIDGVAIRSWSGEVPWERFEFDLKADSSETGISDDENISSKLYTLEWIYSKDFANSSGLDAAFLDNIDLPIATNNSSQQPAFVYVQPSSDGALDIEVVGQPGGSYAVEVSKGLQTWEVIHRGVTDSEGRMQLRGVSGGGKAQSFYRAVTE